MILKYTENCDNIYIYMVIIITPQRTHFISYRMYLSVYGLLMYSNRNVCL